MKQYLSCQRLRFLPVMMLLCLGIFAQQRQDIVVKQELALSVSDDDQRPRELPAFDGGGGSMSNFKRIDSWKPASSEPPVRQIDFKINREGALVIAHLSVTLENEKVVIVGTYRLLEGQTTKTEELMKFGLQPLVLKVVKAKPRFKDPFPPIAPQIENKTKSIEVVGFYKEEHPSDSFLLTLRNISNKNIVALDMFMPSPDGNGGSGERARGDKSHPVIVPGGTLVHHIYVSRGGRQTSEGFVPDPQLQQTLIIRTVVFDDGTYEGLAEPAAAIEAQRRGLDIQRRRILGMLQKEKEAVAGDVFTTLNDLKEQAYALGKTADPALGPELIAKFPSLNEKLKGWLIQNVEEGLRDGKLEWLRYLKDFEDTQKRPGEPITLVQWVEQTKAKYQKLTTTF